MLVDGCVVGVTVVVVSPTTVVVGASVVGVTVVVGASVVVVVCPHVTSEITRRSLFNTQWTLVTPASPHSVKWSAPLMPFQVTPQAEALVGFGVFSCH